MRSALTATAVEALAESVWTAAAAPRLETARTAETPMNRPLNQPVGISSFPLRQLHGTEITPRPDEGFIKLNAAVLVVIGSYDEPVAQVWRRIQSIHKTALRQNGDSQAPIGHP